MRALTATAFLVAVAYPLISHKGHAIGGISGSKVLVPSADTVGRKRFEAEPFFVFEFTGDEKETKRYDAGVRLTYGFMENLEAGLSYFFFGAEHGEAFHVSSKGFGDTELGVKYKLNREEDFSLAAVSGMRFPVVENSPWVAEPAGLVLTKNLSDRLSLDAGLVAGFSFGNHNPRTLHVISQAGLGYFVTPSFQPVVEIAYKMENKNNEVDASIITLTGGFTVLFSKVFTLVVGVSPDIVAAGTERHISCSVALTMLF
ncbi:MAG: hypothetical protein QXX77_06655, partial [Candidatus Methanosuratincola sp.]